MKYYAPIMIRNLQKWKISMIESYVYKKRKDVETVISSLCKKTNTLYKERRRRDWKETNQNAACDLSWVNKDQMSFKIFSALLYL